MVRQKTSLSSAPSSLLAAHTLILDNGAHTIKAGFSTSSTCDVIPNCIARSPLRRDNTTYIVSELTASCKDFAELQIRRPVEKGCIVNWEGQKAIWERSLFEPVANGGLGCNPHETNLILTEAPNAPVALQRNADEMVFEEFEFAGLYRTIAPVFNAYAPSPFQDTTASRPGVPTECMLVVDAGHSHTTITPLYHGQPLYSACRRLEVGGKTITNQLKEVVSRQIEVYKEDWVVGEIKEDVCFVSQSFTSDLESVWKGGLGDRRSLDPSIVVDYVMPDYGAIKHGFARPHDPKLNLRNAALGLGPDGQQMPRETIITLGNERFVPPELLFTPGDIGMQQDGLCGTILQSIHSLPEGLHQPFLANIVVVGGTSKLPGFIERVEAELRSRVSDDVVVRVARAEDPIKNAWLGGVRMAQNEELLKEVVITRAEYQERGEGWTRRKFAGKTER